MSYVLIVLFGLIRFQKVIIKTEWLILSLALFFFALSIIIDQFDNLFAASVTIFIEDSFKLLGIASWVGYFVLTSFQINKTNDKQLEKMDDKTTTRT